VTGNDRAVVVALGAVDASLVTDVLGPDIRFVPRPTETDLAVAAGAIIRADVDVDRALLDRAPRLRVLARTGVGVDRVDVEAATARRIPVVVTPGSGTRGVAEGVLALALHLVKRLSPMTALVRDGRWEQRADPEMILGDLDGATMGIIGFGRIGRRVGELAAAFGMRVLAYDPVDPPPGEVGCGSLAELAANSDIVTLHVPLTEQTRRMVDATFLDALRPGAIMNDSTPRTWFITGASRGFGAAFAAAALAAGERVAATARRPETLQALVDDHGDRILPLRLDVTDRAEVDAAVRVAVDAFGRIDVVVNNAGYGLLGGVEEVTEDQARAQIETNFFGALWVTQAVLPQLRAQGSGHIVQISTIGGIAAFPGLGLYHASKWALEGMSESLAAEVAPLGIRVTLVEPSGFRTDWAGESMRRATPLAAYDGALGQTRAMFSGAGAGQEPGDPQAAAETVREIVDTSEPPLRVLLGNMAVDVATGVYAQRVQEWAAWEERSRSADRGEGGVRGVVGASR
jgi:NAD(P)-dependent dehydrogenase (short-subunit alcohol dehydrogenase family)